MMGTERSIVVDWKQLYWLEAKGWAVTCGKRFTEKRILTFPDKSKKTKETS